MNPEESGFFVFIYIACPKHKFKHCTVLKQSLCLIKRFKPDLSAMYIGVKLAQFDI